MIDPFPFVIEMFDPAVNVAFVNVFPDELPMRSCPSVYDVCPVPPFVTERVPVEIFPFASVERAPAVNPPNTMSPVVEPPSVNVCLLVVPKFPAPVINVAMLPELAETLAVGVPELTFKNPNLAEDVPCPPTNRSTVELYG